MQLIKTSIRNFRSIKMVDINHQKISSLVGENNSGKSAILRALNSFFNFEEEKEYFARGDHQYSNKSNIQIELTFSDVPDKDYYQEYLNKGEISIRMTYSNSQSKRKLYVKKNSKFQQVPEDYLDKLKRDINYVFIPPNRSYEHITGSEKALLK